MRVVNAGYKILDNLDGAAILKKIERVARVCYKSEEKAGEGTAEKLVSSLIRSKHDAMLEHYSFSVLFTVDRGVSHELVRHRVASFAQESTRYCNYGHEGEITVILPVFFDTGMGVNSNSIVFEEWKQSCEVAERKYISLLEKGATPQEARAVLPNSLKTDIVVTANLREWRHILSLRAVGTTGKPHPQMREVMIPLLEDLKERIPVIFDDLEVEDD